MMKKRQATSFWVLCIMLLLLCVMPGSAWAADITVYLTVGADGELQRAADGSVMAYKPVSLEEGATVAEMLSKAHQDYLGGTGWTLNDDGEIEKLWNHEVTDTAKNFFIVKVANSPKKYYMHLKPAGSSIVSVLTEEKVADGNFYFVTDSYNGKNKTTAFFAGNGGRNTQEYFIADVVVKKGEDFAAVLSACNSSRQTYLSKYDIYASRDGGEFVKIDGAATDTKGEFTIKFDETGDYILTAKPQDTASLTNFMRPALHVKVINAEDAPKLENIQISLTEAFSENLLGEFDKDKNEYTMTVSESQIKDGNENNRYFLTYVKAETAKEVLQEMPYLAWATVEEGGSLKSDSMIYFAATDVRNTYGGWYITPGLTAYRVFLLNRNVADCAILAEYVINFRYLPVLTDLQVGEGAVMPEAFASDTKEYEIVIVDKEAGAISITPSINGELGSNEDYTITINGQDFPAGQASELNLAGLDWEESEGIPRATVELTVEKQAEHDNYLTNTYRLNLIKMSLSDEPKFAKEPVGAEYIVGSAFRRPEEQKVAELSVFAAATKPVTYQWYCIANDTEAVSLVGANGPSYLPSVEQAGDYRYYCVAGYTSGEGEEQAEFYSKSAEAKIKVYNDPTPKLVWESKVPAVPADKIDYLNELFADNQYYLEIFKKGCYYYTVNDKNVQPVRFTVVLPDDVQAANPKIEYSWSASGGSFYQKFQDGVFYPPVDKEYGIRLYDPIVSVELLGHRFSFSGLSSEDYKIPVYVDKAPEIIDPTDWVGSGTEDDPWQLGNAEDIWRLAERVNSGTTYEGRFFKMTADITLPKNFTGIGAAPGENSSKGADLLPFSATFDGGNHTLTYEYGAKHPLINVAREATVKNLNIQAPYIKSGALLEATYLDYGSDGDYNAGTGGSYESGTPDTLDINNVTIKSGSNILYAGFIGTNKGSSGANVINILNSRIEKGVNIGYDADKQAGSGQNAIGSFAGKISGTINNCQSSATVYGGGSVGGIVGCKSESMGPFKISNNAFSGEIIASGNYVGGILGAGYGDITAPNTPCVTVTNCYVAADICGNDKIGGIIGGEPGTVQSWNEAYVRNNFYYGKITGAAGAQSVGSIIGYMNGLNKYSIIESNYYLDSCGTDMPIGSAKYIDTSAEHGSEPGVIYVDTSKELPGIAGFSKKDLNRTDDPLGKDREKLAQAMTAAQFMDGTVLGLLNDSATGSKNWTQGELYPVFDQVKVIPVALIIGGEYKGQYYIGEALDMSGAVFTLNMSDGTSQTVSAEQVTISGFDTNTRGEQTLTAAYEGLTATFKVVVLKQGDNPNTPGGNNIRVYFTLLGDSLHGAPTGDDDTHTLAGKNLQTWIARRAVEVDLNATVKDVLEKALTEAGMTWRNPSGSYVEAITYNGVTLAEFSNGNRSGWMYTINGKHSDMAVSEQYLESGDVIIFHYTDDHTLESGSEEFGGMSGGAAGGAGGETGVVLTPGTVEGSDGKNLATMTAREITQAIEGAKKEELANIIIEPIVKGSSGNLSLSLPLDSLGDMAKEELSLYLNSRQGSMVIAPAALEAIAKQASGIDVRLNVENKESKQEAVRAAAIEALGQATGLRGTAEALLENAAITEITITSGGKEISQFDGQELTLYLPVANEAVYSENQSYKVVVVSGDGRVETITGKCVKRGGQLVVQVAVSHLSTFIVTTEKTAELMSFRDVPEDSWFHEAVRFVYEAGLMNGENANEFKPNGSLNRAMLVTILYRLEQEPTPGQTSAFSDVKSGSWYADAVAWANIAGIVNGYEDNSFRPEQNISREELAAVLYRYEQLKGQGFTGAWAFKLDYADADQVAEWAYEALCWTTMNGLIQGDEAKNLNPQGQATRAETAVILMRLLNK